MAVLSPSLPSLNLTQKHTPSSPPTLLAVGPVFETPHLPATLATADAATVLLYPAGPTAAAAAVAFRTAGAAALPARYIHLALLSLARPSPPPSASPGLTASPGLSRRLRRCRVQTLWEAGGRRRCPSRVEINNRSFVLTISTFKRKPKSKVHVTSLTEYTSRFP